MNSVLIVDDDKTSRLFAEMIVRKTGASTINADNGLKAVETVKAGKDIDVILMDMSMPVMDGFEATRIIKNINKEIPIIALTSLNLERHMKRIKKAGCDRILSKPVDEQLLQSAINESIESKNYKKSNGFSCIEYLTNTFKKKVK